MSLTLKLLTIVLLISSFLQASTENKDVTEFLKKKFSANPRIVKLNVVVEQAIPLENVKNWKAYIVSINATVTEQKGTRDVKQNMIWFSDGKTISPDLFDLKSGGSLKDSISPSIKQSFYKKENLLFGNADAKHKIAIFSDPLCPYCRTSVPKIINDVKNDPEMFAVYYYHFPLPSVHPAAVTLVQAGVAAELKGKKDVVLNLYKINVDAREKDVNKILREFNKTMKTNITLDDLKSKAVSDRLKDDLDIATELMVNSTPTIFFDGKVDKTRTKYLEAK